MFGKNVAIIEFGTTKLTVMAARTGVDADKALLANASVPYCGYYGGEFMDEFSGLLDALRNAVSEAEKQARRRLKEFFVALPAHFMGVVNESAGMEFDCERKITETDVSKLAEKANNFSGLEDFSLVDCIGHTFFSSGNRLAVVRDAVVSSLDAGFTFVFMHDYFYKTVRRLMKEAGLKLRGIIPADIAQAECFVQARELENSSVFIDVGGSAVSVAVRCGKAFADVVSFHQGGAYLTDMIARRFGIDFDDAEVLKRSINLNLRCVSEDDVYSVGGKYVSAAQAAECVMQWIDTMAKDVADTLMDAADALVGDVVAYVTGGGLVYIKGAVEYFSAALGDLPVMVLTEKDHTDCRPENSAAEAVLKRAVWMMQRNNKENKVLRY